MTDADKPEFAQCMTALGVVSGAGTDTPLIAAYWQFLRDVPLSDFKRAVTQAGGTLKWFPKPSELRELAGIVPLASRGEEAWAIVRTAMDRYDYTDSVDFGPVVNAVVRQLGGWQYLCDQSIPDLVWRAKEFVAAFAVMASKPVDEHRAGPLAGFLPGPVRRIEAPGSISTPLLVSRASGEVLDVVRELADSKAVG